MPQQPDAALPPPSRPAPRLAWRSGAAEHGPREVAEETAVAFTFNRATHAVMMATPADLEDFAVGFSLSEGIVDGPADIEELDIVPAPQGVELRMWIGAGRMAALETRRRRMAGPTGCGLCGLDSLAQAMRPAERVTAALRVSARELQAAMALLGPAQALNHRTRAVHAAGFVRPGAGLVLLREDVGRHNALDKLAGAVARAGLDAAAGLVVMTSRVSVELVQKAARMGVPVLAAVSAPTALAIRMAEAAGLTLVGIARADGFEVFTHPERVETNEVQQHVVRGGAGNVRSFQDGTRLGPNGFGFSVQTAPGVSVDELARGGNFPNSQISVSTIGRLQAIPGVAVISPTPGFGECHGTVKLPYPPPSGIFRAIRDVFTPQPNQFVVPR